MGRSQNVLQ